MSSYEDNRTWCKYEDCSLEKLEEEFCALKTIWSRLEKNWAQPKDYEDVYRIYPLLDTTAALSRKRLENNKDYFPIEIIVPNETAQSIDTSEYLYSDEHAFFNGTKKHKDLKLVVSTFLHTSFYVYMDTRKDFKGEQKFDIYIYVETDIRKEYINIKDFINRMEEFIESLITEKNNSQPTP